MCVCVCVCMCVRACEGDRRLGCPVFNLKHVLALSPKASSSMPRRLAATAKHPHRKARSTPRDAHGDSEGTIRLRGGERLCAYRAIKGENKVVLILKSRPRAFQ